MRKLQISNYETLLDDEDFERLKNDRWHITTAKSTAGKRYVYAGRFEIVDGKARMRLMHRIVSGAPRGMVVDHINGNTLDNTRANLRVCTYSENLRNRVSKTAQPIFLPLALVRIAKS